jgi:VIT1/CCC1 family predicted Fe2+/Mn2+ transporter
VLILPSESYEATLRSTRALIHTSPAQTDALVRKAFKPYNLAATSTSAISRTLHQNPAELLDFLMRFHHQQAAPDTSRPIVSAATIAGGYFLGGFVPLLPYFCVDRADVLVALWWSVGVMIVALFAFGWAKTGVVCGWGGRSNVVMAIKSGLQMVVVGGVAAGAAAGLVRAINGAQ